MALVSKPDWIKPDFWLNQGEKYAPTFTQIEGKLLGAHRKRKDVDPATIIGRAGVMAVESDYPGFADRNRYLFLHANMWAYLNRPSNTWTKEEVEAVAAALPLVSLEMNDFGEGDFSFQPDSPQAKWFYAKRKAMYDAWNQAHPEAPIVRRDAGHHGNVSTYQGNPWYAPGGAQISPNSPQFRNLYQSVDAARGSCAYFSNGLEDLIGVNMKNFADRADYANSYYYQRHATEIMATGMRKTLGLAGGPNLLLYNDWGKIEGIGEGNNGTLHNGILYNRRINNPAGTVTTGAHSQVDFDWQTACILIIGFLYADGYLPFDHSAYGVDPNTMNALNTPGPGNDNQIPVLWTPDVPGTPAPVSQDGFPVEPNKWHDASYLASYYYSQFDRTAGQQWKPAPYKFGGSETIITPPADGASTLEHAAAFDGATTMGTGSGARRGRPTADYRYKNGALDLVTFDASRSRFTPDETIYVLAPNGIDFIPSKLRGCVPNVHRETI